MSVSGAVRTRVLGSLSSVSSLFGASDGCIYEHEYYPLASDQELGAPSPSMPSAPAQLRASGGQRCEEPCVAYQRGCERWVQALAGGEPTRRYANPIDLRVGGLSNLVFYWQVEALGA